MKAMVFPVAVLMWELGHKEGWVPKNWCFQTVVLEKTLESPLDRKEIQSVHPKGNQSWVFIGRTDAEAEAPILWPPDENWLTGKDPDARKDWRQEGKGTTEDEMVRWHHWLDGHEFEQAPGVGDGQGRLGCYRPSGHKESDMSEPLNWTELNWAKVEVYTCVFSEGGHMESSTHFGRWLLLVTRRKCLVNNFSVLLDMGRCKKLIS